MPTVWGTGRRRVGIAEERRLAPPSFRRELTPTWLSTCALLAGAPPLDPSRGLRVLDLQCRSGVQAAVLAAVHPDAEILAYDREPAHVERARDLATTAGLDNLSVAEATNPRSARWTAPATWMSCCSTTSSRCRTRTAAPRSGMSSVAACAPAVSSP